MAIRYERAQDRAVDSDTGEYLTAEQWHYQSPTRDYSIYAGEDTKVCTATVEQQTLDLSGDGRVGLHKVKVLRIRKCDAADDASFITDEASPLAQQLVRLLTVYLVDHPGVQVSVEIAFDLHSGETQ